MYGLTASNYEIVSFLVTTNVLPSGGIFFLPKWYQDKHHLHRMFLGSYRGGDKMKAIQEAAANQIVVIVNGKVLKADRPNVRIVRKP